MDIENLLLKEKQETEKLLSQINQDILKYQKSAGNRKLACTSSHGKPQYMIDGKYAAKKDLPVVESIARSRYCEEMLIVTQKKRKAIECLLPYYSEERLASVYEKTCDGRRKLLVPYEISKEEFIRNWIAYEYTPYDRWDDATTEFYTGRNERVRSKAEMIIANELDRYNIPYRYECPLELLDGRQKRIIHPDFTVLNRRTLHEYIIEHLGMLDRSGYFNTSMKKIDLMERNGYLIGTDLLIFHETVDSPLNVRVVRNYIEEYLL